MKNKTKYFIIIVVALLLIIALCAGLYYGKRHYEKRAYLIGINDAGMIISNRMVSDLNRGVTSFVFVINGQEIILKYDPEIQNQISKNITPHTVI